MAGEKKMNEVKNKEEQEGRGKKEVKMIVIKRTNIKNLRTLPPLHHITVCTNGI